MTKDSGLTDTVSNLFAGAGLGAVVGLIAGLSVSPVVSIVLGALAALIAAFLGVDKHKNTEMTEAQEQSWRTVRRLNGLRAASFGIACVIGIALGIYARVEIAAWTFGRAVARREW